MHPICASKWDPDIPLVIVICPEVGTQPKLAQPDKQEDLTFPKPKGQLPHLCLPLSLAGHKRTFSPSTGNSATVWETCLSVKPALGKSRQRNYITVLKSVLCLDPT